MFRNPIEKIPRYLYKYFSNIDRAKSAIENRRIHFELPSDYNDVFDSAISINEDGLNVVLFSPRMLSMMSYFVDREYKEVFTRICEEKLYDCQYMNQVFNILENEDIPKEVVNRLKRAVCQKSTNLKAPNNRITCFSEANDTELMWAHYGKHLEGVCLCYDTSLDKELFQNAHKVIYTNSRPQAEINNFNIYFNKSLAWIYEQEWRIVIDTPNEYRSTNSCVGIIMGEKLDVENTLAFMGYNLTHNMKIYKAKADTKDYKINIQSILET